MKRNSLPTRLGTLGSLSHNFTSSSECTNVAFALLEVFLSVWPPFSLNAIFKLARENTVTKETKTSTKRSRVVKIVKNV